MLLWLLYCLLFVGALSIGCLLCVDCRVVFVVRCRCYWCSFVLVVRFFVCGSSLCVVFVLMYVGCCLLLVYVLGCSFVVVVCWLLVC